MVGKLAAGALEAVATVVGAARHLAWYVSHQMDGEAHEAPAFERRSGREGARADEPPGDGPS